jgi:hypothetical protein
LNPTPTRRTFLAVLVSALAWLVRPVPAQTTAPARGGRRPRNDEYPLPGELADYAALALVLGRITDHSVTLSAMAAQTMEGSANWEQVQVDYVRTYLPKDETAGRKTGDVAHTYTIKAKVPHE